MRRQTKEMTPGGPDAGHADTTADVSPAVVSQEQIGLGGDELLDLAGARGLRRFRRLRGKGEPRG